ncbi:MAG TPA: MBOAT family O-acyltransferase [Polyangia bacterium]|nr:MBOAT family O-acyltransferase [Polyangia bacterium]
MTTAPSLAIGRPQRTWAARPVVTQAILAAAALAAIWVAGPVFGLEVPAGAATMLAVGSLALAVWPARAREISVLACVALLVVSLRPARAAYHLALVVVLYGCRRRTWKLFLALGLGAVVVPKALYAASGGRAALDAAGLASIIFVTLYWAREARSGKTPVSAAPADWGALYLMPFNPIYAIAFGPNDVWRARRVDGRLVLAGAAVCLLKAGGLLALRRAFPLGNYAAWSPEALAALPAGRLWGVVALNYLRLVLLLSGLAEAGILVARLYGWPLPAPFRFALLAWNPVELWRRWGIYTRKFLLKTVYFPLGGSERHRFRNVMSTFLASALVLHSGWLGSPYWIVGTGGWRDHAIYFGLQGLAVCACLAVWQVTGKDSGSDRALRWSPARVPATLATQAFSAWAHIIILAQGVPLTGPSGRFRLMARCLGL